MPEIRQFGFVAAAYNLVRWRTLMPHRRNDNGDRSIGIIAMDSSPFTKEGN